MGLGFGLGKGLGLGLGVLAVPTRRDHRVVVSDLYADARRDGGAAGSDGGGAVAPKVVRVRVRVWGSGNPNPNLTLTLT